ncbi:phospholipase D-like domain-containing protein [Accumulibacter sp.]|uniref:phospholipase D-like domain-containing protein n=1 Tax=Accumulibacter sp. TaxID=2053492 RepID=UPI001A541351|nr:phospholipase D-like domain-containing protein [Accumulibacter sp.]MBL8374895.1 hypothetical protein [Accumulibacter sp.]
MAPARCGQLRLTRAALLASVVLPIVCLVILAGCAMHSDWQKPPEEYARPPRADSLFAAAEQRIADRHGPGHSGFALLERGDRTLQWRLVLIDSAQYSIDLQYYVWFGDTLGRLMMFRVIQAADRGVQVRILTNSLSSHDVPAVNSHYQKWRQPILETGAFLHELRADAAVRGEIVDLAPLTAEFAGLHTKAMVIDRQRAFVGSMNLDPRSAIHNSEMGVIIDSPPLAERLAQRMERDLHGENSWQVILADDGALRWRSAAGELDRQPAATSCSASKTSS